MLDMTLKTEFVPGTNLKGDFACADWRFLLPTLDQGTILCIGLPSEGAIRVLSSLAENVFVVHPDKKTSTFENVKYLTRAELTKALFSNESISLIYLVKDYKNFIEEDFGGKLLGKNGAIYFENNGWKGRQNASSLVKEFERHGLKSVDTFWLTPLKGDLRTAVPLQHNDISSYFFANVLYGQSFKNKMISRFGKSLSDVGMLEIITTKRAYLIRSSDGKKSLSVPDYIVDIAEKSGFDLSDMRIGLSARGKYNANKVIFFLFKNETCEPEAVIKMTRAPEFNYRLENENHVLRNLHENQIVDAGTYPEPMFFGYHHDLALTCIKAVHGKPFRTRTKATEDCPYAQKALHWLVQLGTKSVNKQACSALEVAGYLHTLFQRFIEIYHLSEEEQTFLEQQIKTMKESGFEFPTVFQHGDPGIWNIMISNQDEVIFIDWEAGEPLGLPLWDIFYFFKTYASWVCRVAGSRDPLKNFKRHFFNRTPLNSLLVETTRSYCQKIGLSSEFIKPLFYTCWMHRALKESTRLTNERLNSGQFFNILKLCIEECDSVALNALLEIRGYGNSDLLASNPVEVENDS